MLKKRIIPCLDIKNGRTVKGINFLNIRDAGDPVALAKKYVEEGADELVFLDITATIEKRKTLVALVEKIATEINIPFTVGGGINSLEDCAAVINAGADKVSINSAAVRFPGLIGDIAQCFGSQCVVLAMDIKMEDEKWWVYTDGGRLKTNKEAISWARQGEAFGAGEILLTSMNSDGTRDGFALPITDQISDAVSIPVIASGGAGSKDHFLDLFKQTNASAGLAASIFHFNEISISELKSYLKKQNINIR